jgi:hypothetical protein
MIVYLLNCKGDFNRIFIAFFLKLKKFLKKNEN